MIRPDPANRPAPSRGESPRTYAESLADAEARRRDADDVLVRGMIQTRDDGNAPDPGAPADLPPSLAPR
jgi:hypothetical protein